MAGAQCLSSDEGVAFVSEASGGRSWRVWHTGSVSSVEDDILERFLVGGFLDVGVLDLVDRADVGVFVVGVCRCRFKCRFLVDFSLEVSWVALHIFF